MIAGDSLTGWDGAGVQAQGLLPGTKEILKQGICALLKGQWERFQGWMKEDEQVTQMLRMDGVLPSHNYLLLGIWTWY